METLGIHIEYLLQRHECVILPRIGAFIATHRAARIDEATGEYIPPTRSICFNSAVCNDDGLLVNSIARKEQISFAEARQAMQLQIEQTRRMLESDAEVTIGKVGILSLDDEGNISFMPRLDTRMMSARMGMPTLDLSFLHPEAKQQTAPAPAAPAAPAPTRAHRDVRLGDRYYIISKRRVKRLVRATGYAAAIAIIAIAGAMAMIGGLGMERNASTPSEASVVPETITKVIVPKRVEMPKQKTSVTTADMEIYSLVVGSFGSEAEADEYMAQHSESDYGLQKEHSKKHCFVTAAVSADRDALLSLSADSEFAKEYPQSWVRKRK